MCETVEKTTTPKFYEEAFSSLNSALDRPDGTSHLIDSVRDLKYQNQLLLEERIHREEEIIKTDQRTKQLEYFTEEKLIEINTQKTFQLEDFYSLQQKHVDLQRDYNILHKEFKSKKVEYTNTIERIKDEERDYRTSLTIDYERETETITNNLNQARQQLQTLQQNQIHETFLPNYEIIFPNQEKTPTEKSLYLVQEFTKLQDKLNQLTISITEAELERFLKTPPNPFTPSFA